MTDVDPLSATARELKDSWFAMIRNTQSQSEDRKTLCFAGASPNHYVNAYTLEIWQSLFFTLNAKSIKKFNRRFINSAPLSEPSLWKAEKALSSLEFRDQITSPVVRMHVRQKIILHQLSAWVVRQAFNSLALKRVGHTIEIRNQPQWLYLPSTALLYASSVATMIFFGQAALDAIAPSLGQLEVGWLFLKLELSILLMLATYRLGPQWKNGEVTLLKMGFKQSSLVKRAIRVHFKIPNR